MKQAPAPHAERLPLVTLLAYSLPSAALSFTYMLTTVYLLKYATDVLLVAPGAMGLLFGLSRIWDAVSDPVAGHLSDRTHSRFGRRRSWLLASALPIGLSFGMLWCPPPGLAGASLTVWMGVGVFAYFTAITVFAVPHESLGAELSQLYHERTRVFGVKHVMGASGSLVGLLGMFLLIRAQEPRATALVLSMVAFVALVAAIAFAVARVRERPEYQGRGGRTPHAAFRDVLRNPHAAILLVVFGIENFGTAMLAVLVPFVMQYVLGLEHLTTFFMLLYFVPAILFVPVWIRLSRAFGKRNLWVFSMAMLSVAFCGLFFVRPGDAVLLSALGLIAGIGGGCGQVVGPSIQADVIDFDEYRTGERKEGAYFALWNFVRKTATGLAVMLTGLLLDAVGFVPNAAQSEEAKLGLRLLFGIVPGVCYALGTLLFLRFRLNQQEHAAIRAALSRRAALPGASGTLEE